MSKLIELLFREPLLLFVIGAWIFGMIGNAAKAKKKRATQKRRRSATSAKVNAAVQPPIVDQRRGVSLQPSASRPKTTAASPAAAPSNAPLAGSSAQTPEEIAQEMRRVLGIETVGPRRPAE